MFRKIAFTMLFGFATLAFAAYGVHDIQPMVVGEIQFLDKQESGRLEKPSDLGGGLLF